MLNSHLKPKPYAFAKPDRFAKFFTDALPLVLLPRMTYVSGETLQARVRMANYSKKVIEGAAKWSLCGEGFSLCGELAPVSAQCGALTDLGMLRIPLCSVQKGVKLTLTVSLCGCSNDYSIWVYPDEEIACPQNVYECRSLDERALDVLRSGGAVFLAPDSTQEALPVSIKSQFSTDFWSVGTFPAQPGGMGQLIDASHPIFAHFPTDTHTNWQWWPMASARAVILPQALRKVKPIVTVMDSYAYLRHMAQLMECRCGGGRLLLCTMGLHNLMQYPEARALLGAIYRYMGSEQFAPEDEIAPEIIFSLVK